ncbi:hypothetical protein [Mesorhizobium caraganae]|uniref:hypothetical protein n=1 Tax=Mesorhizobium caraganae TaxID=483206 RepID=UPI003ECF6FDD
MLLLDGRLSMLQRGLERPVVDADDELSGGDVLVVLDEDLIDVAGDPRRQRRDVAADIGIVGRDEEAAALLPLDAIPSGGTDDDHGCQRQPRLAALFGGCGDLHDRGLRRLQLGGGKNLVHWRASSDLCSITVFSISGRPEPALLKR